MTDRVRTVTVKQVPETADRKRTKIFFQELESYMNIDRPGVVLDCSKIRQMDRSTIHLLLCCLEEAMKRNGDVKLAVVSSGSKAILELARIDRLYEIYDTTAEAAASFHQVPSYRTPDVLMPSHAGTEQTSENAA